MCSYCTPSHYCCLYGDTFGVFSSTAIITMVTNKCPRKALTFAEAEAQCTGYMVMRSRKCVKGGSCYLDLIWMAPASQQAGPSFQSCFNNNALQDGNTEQPPADPGMLEDNTTHFGRQGRPQKPCRVPGLVHEKQLQIAVSCSYDISDHTNQGQARGTGEHFRTLRSTYRGCQQDGGTLVQCCQH